MFRDINMIKLSSHSQYMLQIVIKLIIYLLSSGKVLSSYITLGQ